MADSAARSSKAKARAAEEEADDVIQTEGGARTEAESRPERSLVAVVADELFHPSVRWGNTKLAIHAGVFALCIWVSQRYGYLLAQ